MLGSVTALLEATCGQVRSKGGKRERDKEGDDSREENQDLSDWSMVTLGSRRDNRYEPDLDSQV